METNDEAKILFLWSDTASAVGEQDHRDVAGMLLIGSTEMLWAGY